MRLFLGGSAWDRRRRRRQPSTTDVTPLVPAALHRWRAPTTTNAQQVGAAWRTGGVHPADSGVAGDGPSLRSTSATRWSAVVHATLCVLLGGPCRSFVAEDGPIPIRAGPR